MDDKVINTRISDLVKANSYLENLKSLLDSVSDTYPDFILGVCSECRNEDHCTKMIDYIQANRKATSVDILNYLYDEILLIDKIS